MHTLKRFWLRFRLLRLDSEIRAATQHRGNVAADIAEQTEYEASLHRHIINKQAERSELQLKLRALEPKWSANPKGVK